MGGVEKTPSPGIAPGIASPSSGKSGGECARNIFWLSGFSLETTKKHVSVGSSSQEFDADKFTPEARESWRRTEWPKAYVTLDPHRL